MRSEQKHVGIFHSLMEDSKICFFFAMINQGSNIATIRGIIIFSKVGGIHSIHI